MAAWFNGAATLARTRSGTSSTVNSETSMTNAAWTTPSITVRMLWCGIATSTQISCGFVVDCNWLYVTMANASKHCPTTWSSCVTAMDDLRRSGPGRGGGEEL